MDTYCTPALIYLGISLFGIIVIVVQNLVTGNSEELCIGSMKCPFSHKLLLLGLKVIYIAIWTWFLNFLCRKGMTSISWFLLLIPFLISAIVIAGLIWTQTTNMPAKNHNNVHHSHHHLH